MRNAWFNEKQVCLNDAIPLNVFHVLYCRLKTEVPDYLRGESQKETSENSQLYAAAINGDIKQLILALDKGANPNYFHRHDDGTPGVLHAVARNVSENDAALCAKELIGRGARISAALISNRNTPIHEGTGDDLIEDRP